MPEGIVHDCCIMPTLNLGLVTTANTGNGAGGQRAGNMCERNQGRSEDGALVSEDSHLTAAVNDVVIVGWLLSGGQRQRVGRGYRCMGYISTSTNALDLDLWAYQDGRRHCHRPHRPRQIASGHHLWIL